MRRLVIILFILVGFIVDAQTPAKNKLTKPGINSNFAITTTSEKINLLSNVTSDVQTQLDNKINAVDSINPFDYVYTKKQTKALPTPSSFLEGLQRAGYDIKALPAGVNSANILTGTYTLIDGDWQYTLVDVTDSVTLTGLGCMINTPQASYTADGYNGFAIHSVNSTTGVMTKVAETPNDGNLWKAAAYAKVQKAFTTPVLLVPGTYAFSLIWNASATTTPPKIYMHGTTSARLEFWHSAATRLSGKVAAQSAVPTTVNPGAGNTFDTNIMGIVGY